MKYKLIKPWLDEYSVVHPIGEIVEMDDKKRADNLIKLGAFEPYIEEAKGEEEKEDAKKSKNASKTSKKK